MGYTSDGGFTIDETKGRIAYTVTEDDLKRKPKQDETRDTESSDKNGEKSKGVCGSCIVSEKRFCQRTGA